MIYQVTDSLALATLASACALVGVFDDGSAYLDSANVLGWGDPLHGAFLFKPIDAHSVEGHVLVHPNHRGREAIEAGRECLIKIHSLGLAVVAPAPKGRRDVRMYTRQIGLIYAGETHESVFMYQGRN